MQQENDIIVSVCCATYNHEPYIRQCLDGFVMQQTNFAFEILIHDDASTDGTADIIREYEAKYPDIIKPIYQTENQYSKGVPISATYIWPRAKGKYIALCEGDDYWIDPLKLQKQVDFLEANEEYVICGTNAIYDSVNLDLNGKLLHNYIKREFDEHDFKLQNNLITCTVVYRNVNYTFNRVRLPFGDWLLYISILNKSHKKAFEFNEPTAVYRVHEGGVFSGASQFHIYKRHIIQINGIYNRFRYLKDKNYYARMNDYFMKALGVITSTVTLFTFGFWFFIRNPLHFPKKRYLRFLCKKIIRRTEYA